MKQERIDASQLELNEKVVSIKRVTKVVKGGRNMRFTALVVVGDGNGHVGAGLGKATEIPEAIRKGKEDAAKHLITVALNENESIVHDFIGKFGGASVLLKTAPEGTGVIAGGPARAVIEMAGIKNIRTKSLGSNNKQNVVLATIDGLRQDSGGGFQTSWEINRRDCWLRRETRNGKFESYISKVYDRCCTEAQKDCRSIGP